MTDHQSTHGPDCWSWGPKHYECAVAEIERLRREVRDWMCDRCNTVYPGPPQPGIWCVQCPRCGGDTAPQGVIERRRLEREIERLRREREEVAAVLKAVHERDMHIHTCDHCECALCPEGTELSYKAYISQWIYSKGSVGA